MESQNNIQFSNWLSKKLYLINVALYATIGVIMLLPQFCFKTLCIPYLGSLIISFFIVTILRALFETLVIYEAPVKSLSVSKILTLAVVNTVVLTAIFYLIKPKVGYFSIPVSFLISLMVIGRLKALLWPTSTRTGFFAKLPTKLQANSLGIYSFYGFLVGITYLLYGVLNINFFIAFALGYFIGMVFEESYNLTGLFEEKLNLKSITPILSLSAICAIASSTVICLLMNYGNYSGQVATIIVVEIFKLIQPMLARKFILKV
jgi:hypothetical protein